MDKYFKLCMFLVFDDFRECICHTFIRYEFSDIKSVYEYFYKMFPTAKFTLNYVTEEIVDFSNDSVLQEHSFDK